MPILGPPRPPLPDPTVADQDTLNELDLEPDPLPPDPQPEQLPTTSDGSLEDANRDTLTDALSGTGTQPTPQDQAAIDAVATLNSATVDTVTQWILRDPNEPSTVPDSSVP